MAKRVMIVDDNVAIRSALRRAFSQTKNFFISGEASNGKEAIDYVAKAKPHLIILDISMPVMSGIAAAPRLRKLAPKACVIFFSTFASTEVERVAKEVGVHGVVSKMEGTDKLLATAHSLLGLKTESTTIN